MVIGISAPASPVVAAQIEIAERILAERGVSVLAGESIGASFGYFAGTTAQRFSDLKGFIEDPEVSAIWVARGGHGCFETASQKS